MATATCVAEATFAHHGIDRAAQAFSADQAWLAVGCSGADRDEAHHSEIRIYPGEGTTPVCVMPLASHNRLAKNGQTSIYAPDSDKLTHDAAGNAYTFDQNGNQLTKGGWTYTYDWDNQLKTATSPDGTVIEYWYDVEGHRIGKRVIENSQTTTTRYVVDANQAYAQVLEELDGAGQITARYTYGDDLLKASRDGEYYYFHDGSGSVRLMTDASGQVVNRYTYDAYGNLLPGEAEETIANDYKCAMTARQGWCICGHAAMIRRKGSFWYKPDPVRIIGIIDDELFLGAWGSSVCVYANARRSAGRYGISGALCLPR